MEFQNWAFTLQIPSFKQVRYISDEMDKRLAFKNLTIEQQEKFMEACLLFPQYEDKQEIKIDKVWERHADGRIHCHGTLHDLTLEDVVSFQQSVCRFIGITTQKQFNQIFNYLPIYNKQGWDTYCQKEQQPDNDDLTDWEDKYKDYAF